jgi:hypothetical protein
MAAQETTSRQKLRLTLTLGQMMKLVVFAAVASLCMVAGVESVYSL